jgi:Reversibly glycosylated polypeptide
MSKITAVVASNREKSLQEFLAAWNPPPWDETIVVEDGPRRSFDLGLWHSASMHHFCWADIDADEDLLAPTPFSRRDSAIKMYGFWAALRLRADVVICLDDDCHPYGPLASFTADHNAALSPRARWVSSVDSCPTRGVPYFDLGTIAGAVANMGLWRGIADYDAPQTLALHRLGYLDHSYAPISGNRLMHPEHYWPFCGMNIAFRREIAPLMYMPKMGDGSPYRRFDDIWCGVILQRCCRHLGLSLAVGAPHIRHLRASDPLANLEKEAPGIRANDAFWKIVEQTPLDASRQSTPLTCAEAVAAHFTSASRHDSDLAQNAVLAGYLAAEGERMRSWCNMFRNAGWA